MLLLSHATLAPILTFSFDPQTNSDCCSSPARVSSSAVQLSYFLCWVFYSQLPHTIVWMPMHMSMTILSYIAHSCVQTLIMKFRRMCGTWSNTPVLFICSCNNKVHLSLQYYSLTASMFELCPCNYIHNIMMHTHCDVTQVCLILLFLWRHCHDDRP